MKLTTSLITVLAITVPAALAVPVDVEARVAKAQYGDYGSYPPPAGGYGSYGSYKDVSVPAPVPAPASYGEYPAPAGGYASYGAYRKRALEYLKSFFA